jgi:hypothetical protein
MSPVEMHLRDKGADDPEIEAMKNLGRQNFRKGIGSIVYESSHFNYRDVNGNHYEGQTRDNCGLYALKRLLFVLGRYGKVPETLWYEYTDQELRDKLAVMSGGKKFVSQDKGIDILYLVKLMVNIGVPIEYCKVHYYYNGKEMKEALLAANDANMMIPLTADELTRLTVRIHEELPRLKKRVQEAVVLANTAMAETKRWMSIVENDAENDSERDIAAVKVIRSAWKVRQALADAGALRMEAFNNYNGYIAGFFTHLQDELAPKYLLPLLPFVAEARCAIIELVDSATESMEIAEALAKKAAKIRPGYEAYVDVATRNE